MSRPSYGWIALAIVAAVVAGNAIVLAPELTVGRVDLNDSVFHATIVDEIVNRVSHGEGALDFWMPEWSFGYPVLRAYQPLGAWLVAAVQLATGQHVPLDAMFAFVKFILLVTFPLSVYAASRLLDFEPLTAAAIAVVSPLVSSPNLYGIEYGSYVFRGNGLFTQLVAMHLFVLAIGAGSRAIRRGRGVTVAALLVALTILAHLIYGYMAAASIVLIAALPNAEVPVRRRFIRLFWIGALSFALTAFLLVPMFRDGAFINRSRWEPAWKWESFGLKQVAVLVATGEVVDSQRLPVLAVLALVGTIAVYRRRSERRFAEWLAVAGAVLWMFLFAGSRTWGPLFNVLGIGDQVQAHRFVGGLQWFLILLAGLGLAHIWSMPYRHAWRFPLVWSVLVTVALLALPVADRISYMRDDSKWGLENLNAWAAQRPDIDRTIALLKQRGGRAYPGLAATWGNQFKIGYVPFHAFLSRAHVPAIAFLYHAMALPADIMVRFNENRPDHYRLFDIRSVIADRTRRMPFFLTHTASFGPFRVYSAPPSSAFDLVNVPNSMYVDRRTFYDVNDAWLQSIWSAERTHVLLDYESAVPADPLPRIAGVATFSQPPGILGDAGTVQSERAAGDVYEANVSATRDCFLLLKSTYHPNWRVTVDGKAARAVMLTPGFAGVRLAPGHHSVTFRYDHGSAKTILLLLAFPILIVSFVAERRGWLERTEGRADAISLRAFSGERLVLVLAIALALPCIAPLIGAVATRGHDALEYVPRLVEFHENIRHGILLPRWAPDLSSGQGQPLFLFNPPLFYYVAEAWHLLGWSFAGAINAACATIVIASLLAMFLLARFWFGPAGGLLGSLAYVYAPYFLVDLYVRAAFAELSAFPFYPLALYGFARHAEERKLRWLVIGSIGYAGVWFAHTPAAVLFTPLLGAFVVFLAWQQRSFGQLLVHAGACVLAVALAAPVWLPSAVEANDTNAHLLREGPLKYSNHFVYPRQFFSTKWGYGVSVPGDQDGMPFSLGWAELVVAAIAALFLPKERRPWFAFFALSAFAICFLMTPRSHAIWDVLPQLQYVAFPWRLLASAIVCVALLVASAATLKRATPAAIGAAAALIVLSGVTHARPQSYLTLDPQLWTPRQLAMRGVIPATFDTFEPRWVQTRPRYTGDSVATITGSAAGSQVDRSPERYAVTVRALTDSVVELPVAYFPGWQVKLDGASVPVEPSAGNGRMRVTIGRGEHRIEARYGATPARVASDLVSLLAVIILSGLIALDLRRARTAR